MTLLDHLTLRAPLLWVEAAEPHRVINAIIAAQLDRPLLRATQLEGLVAYEPDTASWRRVLQSVGVNEVGHDILQPIVGLAPSIEYALAYDAILVLEHAHSWSRNLYPLLSEVAASWLDAVRTHDLGATGCSLVCVSHDRTERPPELARYMPIVEVGLPTAAELDALTAVASAPLPTPLKPAQRSRVVRAAQGLSEMEFTQACAQSLRTHRTLDPEFINKTKIAVLKEAGTLEVRPPQIKLTDIGGLDLAKDLIDAVAWIWNNPADAERFQVEPIRKVCMIGVPGTGKSAICEATAQGLGLDLAKAGVSQAMSKWVGESEANMRQMFAQIKAMAPIVMWIDEFGRDMSGSQSSGSTDSGTTDRVHGEFLTGLQELPSNVFLMCAANRIDSLPPEMLRADRFDKFLFVGLPSEAERAAIFRIHLGPAASDLDVDALAARSATFTGAEIKALLRETRFAVVTKHRRTITTEDVLARMTVMKGRVWQNHGPAILDMYQRAMVEWDWASSAQHDDAAYVIDALAARHTVRT